MQFKQYPSYKNSGVEWLGDVPEHWSVIPSKFYFIERKEKAENTDKQLTASQKHGIIFQEDFMAENGRVMVVMKNPEILKKVRPNDFVISMRSFQGGLELSYLEGSISSAYVMLKPNLNVVDIEYFKYLFKTPRYIQSLQSTSNLIRDGQALRFNNFSQIKLVLPPKADQEKIVSFLDTETARIDNLIAKQEKLIELLEEQRKSIISHAVTKGLNPNAPMKDSGVEWLGEVPEHWQILKLRQLVKLESGLALPLNRINPDGKYPVYGGNNIRGFTENFNMKGDYILVGRQGSLCGNINYASGEFWATEHAVVVYPKKPVSLTFLGELLRTMNLNQYSIASAQAGLSVDRISNIYTIYIPFEEQIQIAKKIDHENLKVDKLISKQQSLIEKLKEYRASIISHAVTGKIDVREFGA
ncbi:hypothetical protein BKE30_14100 [Alkanindiges hydrocarboniclasticus]|uniref:Type I restriction modification DNA specificity domain-containing protein n=1 Tax=Alkanindiges hydrocarboniclasticus TaxID=1907941 RepID=A0A1S8CQK2_9GAMM|nr:restriction endonuclease subunit S [Alkanindiges hydrocarboniclasticus]ONG37690.1 hypothetical protein BKE30_14100 [Alkanindiges hydrocarboniclasticus]